jgi:protein phosphatase
MIIVDKTNVGRIRAVNEDHVYTEADWNGFALAIVADGMGGHLAGETASRLAVETVRHELRTVHGELSVEQCKQAVRQAIFKANEKIYSLGSTQEQYRGMGTTIVVVLAHDEVFIVGHIGDSRVYRWKDGTIVQLTEDHTLVNELVKSGQISVEDSWFHPHKHVLSRSLGTDETAEADIQHFEWVRGETLLLCSDGLSNLVSDSLIAQTLAGDNNLEQKAERLIELALQAGGDDNVTVVLLANEPAADGNAG